MINKNYHGQVLSAFWPDDLDVYVLQFPPQGGTWHHRSMLKVTSCGRKCAANKPKPGSAHDRRHIMTSPGHTGISRRVYPSEGIRQYDSSDTGHSDNANIAAEHQEPAEVLSQLDNTSNSPVYGEYKCC